MAKKSPKWKKPHSETDDYLNVTFVAMQPNTNISTFLEQTLYKNFDSANEDNEYTSINNGIFYHHKKTKKNFLINIDENITENELLYAVRSSDFVVFLVSDGISDTSKLSALKRHIPTFIFCILDCDKSKAKKIISDNFGDGKIVLQRNLFDYMSSAKFENTKICKRPYFVPRNYFVENDLLIVRGFMRKGFKCDRLMCNGKFEFKIESICTDDEEITGGYLNAFFDDANIKKVVEENLDCENDESNINCQEAQFASNNSYQCNLENKKNDITFNDINLKDENYKNKNVIHINEYNMKNINDFGCLNTNENDDIRFNQIMESNNSSDYSSEEIDENESSEEQESELIRDYEEGHQDYPDHYKDLQILRNYNYIQNKITNHKSKLHNNQTIVMKLRRLFKEDFSPNILIFFNLYPLEGIKTIYNLQFVSSRDIFSHNGYRLDLGYTNYSIKPIIYLPRPISDGYITCESATEGLMSFIAPLSMINHKLDILEDGNDIHYRNYFGCGTFVKYEDKPILEETIIKGHPQKIDKRYCVIHGMFLSKSEVLYFRNIPIKSNNGNTGIIKKSIGTKGVFKAYFNKPVNHGHVITMSLYKRCYLDPFDA
ncbi:hypothetical protein EDEG_00871 [Edhazardia aedis USNM 41457]|uniref:Ribosome biogenesis protein BMS1/TSR1 C-terminal domain-containing protein n=1 Tax=Edhazardia aedis (strain USNM 41457) TaxID=1003232 RepID=J9DBA9_EDHAE|nr:hypothetical protein EDEG_00871 [Edhazardia aedis USNM 41457]|eukprot:EJW05036.1 hypothetical protein EDEG_00871 [Edhazardia aedis USNM 41457]